MGQLTESVERFQTEGNLLLIADRWQCGRRRVRSVDQFLVHASALSGFGAAAWFLHRRSRRFPFAGFPEIRYFEGDRWRPSANGALQYRNGKLELYAEGLWQGYRENLTDRLWQQPLWNCGQATYSNLVD